MPRRHINFLGADPWPEPAELNATDAVNQRWLVSQGKGFSDVVTAQMSQWGCSRSSAQRDCRWAHDQLQLGMDSHDVQHLIVHVATSLQRIALKAEEDKQYAAAVGAQKMHYELLLRRRMDHEAAKVSRPG